MNKVILITGSTDGIGKLAAIKLAKEGHVVYLHGRNGDKLSRVIEEIKVESGNEKIDGFIADFSNLDEVQKMADRINDSLSKIDVLINNAGVFKSSNSPTKDGLDIRFVVNYLAPYLLTKKLLPLLKNSNEARVINLSSAAQSSVSLDALTGKTTVSTQEAYAQSKLALTIWSFDLAQKEPSISVIALNPGSLLNTNMVKEAFGRFWSSADKGADIIFELATSNQYDKLTGKYFDNDRGTFGSAHSDAYEESIALNLIEVTDRVILSR